MLGELAIQAGVFSEFATAIRTIVATLEARADTWGEAEYHLKKAQSTQFVGAVRPVLVRYVLFELERVVYITQVSPLPDSSLAS